MNALLQFHFLRPAWLLLLIPVAILLWFMFRRQDPSRGLKAVIAPDLLRHLVIQGDDQGRRIKPLHVLAAVWLMACVALAGPAWQKEQTPFAEDRSSLMVVLKVTPTMMAQDIQPSRLTRAVQKTGDLLELRPGTRTGLLAYAGSSHLVMPLTTDPEIITYFASSLAPELMPVEGEDPVQAVEMAARRLQAAGTPASILLVADSIDPVSHAGLARVREAYGFDIHVYAVAAGPDVVPPADSPPAPFLDSDAMAAAAAAGGGRLVTVTPDISDVQILNERVTRSIASAPAGEGARWRDMGYYLLWPLLFLSLLFWRKGGGVELKGSGQ